MTHTTKTGKIERKNGKYPIKWKNKPAEDLKNNMNQLNQIDSCRMLYTTAAEDRLFQVHMEYLSRHILSLKQNLKFKIIEMWKYIIFDIMKIN